MAANNPKDNSRKKGVAEERRLQRQREAAERKDAAAKRTPGEQLQRLRDRGVTSGKEYEKLLAIVNGGKANGEAKHDKHAARLPDYPAKKKGKP